MTAAASIRLGLAELIVSALDNTVSPPVQAYTDQLPPVSSQLVILGEMSIPSRCLFNSLHDLKRPLKVAQGILRNADPYSPERSAAQRHVDQLNVQAEALFSLLRSLICEQFPGHTHLLLVQNWHVGKLRAGIPDTEEEMLRQLRNLFKK
jgi:hypothetical protein